MTTQEDLPTLDAALLRRRLVEEGPYAQLRVADAVDSTNLALTRAAAEPGFVASWPHLSVLTAEEQTGGTGRLGRGWSSPPRSSLSTSVVLRPGRAGADPTSQLPWISLVAGLSLVEVLRAELEIPAELKWPNDVHVQGRKISGILAALVPSTGGAQAGRGADGVTVVLGIGINVLLDAQELPTATSTSVQLELERIDRAEVAGAPEADGDLRTRLLCAFLLGFAENLAELEVTASRASGISVGRSPLGRRILAIMDTLGQEVRVELPGGGAVRGGAAALEEDGSLVVEVTHRRDTTETPWEPVAGTAGKNRRAFSAGDVIHLRRLGG